MNFYHRLTTGYFISKVIYVLLCFCISGALCVICDVNEYRKFMKCLNFPIVDKIFDTLYALCNLLLVKPKNLEDVCSDDTLVSACNY